VTATVRGQDAHGRAASRRARHTPTMPAFHATAADNDLYRAQLRWERRYVQVLVVFDVAACVLAAGVAYLIRFGSLGGHHFGTPEESPRWYLLSVVLLPVVWVVAMALNRAYEPRFLGGGSEEFRRVVNAAVRVVATVATVSYATKAEVARAYVLIVFPIAILLSVAGRIGGRGILHRLRRQGRCMHRVLVRRRGRAGPAARPAQPRPPGAQRLRPARRADRRHLGDPAHLDPRDPRDDGRDLPADGWRDAAAGAVEPGGLGRRRAGLLGAD
jgi:hypothetical protein